MWLTILGVLLLTILLAWAAAWLILRGNDLSAHDHAPNTPLNESLPPSAEHHEAVNLVSGMSDSEGGNPSTPDKNMLANMRAGLDAFGDSADLNGIELREVNEPKGEWVLAENSDPNHRLLYIHGGAFMAGSPRSHRTITTKFARMRGAAVFAVDYRLLPEHKRLDCLHDCQAAYRWILENGPDGPAPVENLVVAGDSAGGNLTLVVAAWTRDNDIRQPDSVVAIAPLTDNTFTSPTLKSNVDTDPMLGSAMGRINRIPQTLMYWINLITTRLSPHDPRISPAHGNLKELPPTLIHASEAEMLVGDARRYANKAAHEGSDVQLATWEHMIHVWHIFEPSLPEAKQAFEHIDDFLKSNSAV